MFSKAKKKQPVSDKAPATPANAQSPKPQAQSPTTSNSKPSSKRSSNMKSPGVPSLISTDVTLEGNLTSSGEVQFDGNIIGNIRAASLIIGEKASVRGEVACENVTIRGRVEGMVRARNVALASTAHIEGDILHSSLSVEPGAHFDGNCRHSEDPLSDEAAKAFDRPVSGGPGKSAPRPVPASAIDETTMAPAESSAFRPVFSPNQQGDDTAMQPVGSLGGGRHNQGASSFQTKSRSPLR